MSRRKITIAMLFAVSSVGMVAAAERPNVVLIMADDLGFADLGCYGSEIETPNLDALAAEGLRFTQFYSTAKCHSSRVALLTGLYCDQAGGAKLSRGATFAEVLSEAGYSTAMVGKWHLSGEPTDFGFERYWGHLTGMTNYFRGDNSFRLDGEAWDVPEMLGGRPFYTTHAAADFTLGFLEEAIEEREPFLVYVAFNAPHYPLQAPAEAVRKYEGRYDCGWDELRRRRYRRQIESGLLPAKCRLGPRPDHVPAWEDLSAEERRWEADRMEVYAAMVDELDRSVGRIVGLLEEKGVLENTLILFCSDNGACPFERTRGRFLSPWDPESFWTYDASWAHAGNTPFRLYKQNQHEGGISSPLIVHWPRGLRTAKGAVTDQPGHLIDFMATFLEVAGAEYPVRIGERVVDPLQGKSLAPIFRGETRAPHETLYFHFGKNRALRQGPWKLVSATGGRWELYDLDSDRAELHDMAGQQPERVAAMEAEWFRFAKQVDRLDNKELVPVGEQIANLEFRKDTSSGAVRKQKEEKKAQVDQELPNILWITSEDHGPEMGCYGDEFATTPHVDALADRGMTFRVAWSCAPVCAPARTAIITGVYPPSLGAEHMRSMVPLPDTMRFFPVLLRERGYFCTNNAKKDYNVHTRDQGWNASSGKAHYRDRAPRQPFFAVFNSKASHEANIRTETQAELHDSAGVRVPAYHPDTEVTRRDWARYYDLVTRADASAGEHLADLEAAGLAEDTIVFYFADHGSGMPRSKRWTYHSGLSVPLVVYFPRRWQHLAPEEYRAGGTTTRLVSFVDLAPTLLSLAGVEPPEWMQGRAFAGKHREEGPAYLYGFRGRMDERYDCIRTVTDGRYHYIRNYNPHLIYGQHVRYNFETPTMAAWQRAYDAGELNAAQSRFWQTKPAEELYDLRADPDEVVNLAESLEHRDVLVELRAAQQNWCRRIRDLGFLPEGEIHARSRGTTPYEMARDDGLYPFERIFAAAELATRPGDGDLAALVMHLNDPDSAVRYWGAIGILHRGAGAVLAARGDLVRALEDDSPYVRVTAALALGRHGEAADVRLAVDRLVAMAPWTEDGDVFVSLAALNALDELDGKAAHAVEAIQTFPLRGGASPHSRYNSYVERLIEKTLSDLANAAEGAEDE